MNTLYYMYGYYTTLEPQYRRAIQPRIDRFILNSFRKECGKSYPKKQYITLRTIACQVTGLEITKETCQIDHIIPFKALLENFLKEENLLDTHLEELFIFPRLRMRKDIKERCLELKKKWITYYNSNCRLRAVFSEFNLKRLRVFKNMETMIKYDEKLILLLKRKYKNDSYVSIYKILNLLLKDLRACREDKLLKQRLLLNKNAKKKRKKHINHLNEVESFELSRLLEIDCV